MQTERGRAMFRQRMWCEVAVTVRAASKALLVPFVLLLLGDGLALPPSLGAFLAFSYLIPWALENAKLASALNDPHVYRRPPLRATRARPAAGPSDGPDCGAAPAAAPLPPITTSEALANIMSATPDRVFMAEGEACSGVSRGLRNG